MMMMTIVIMNYKTSRRQSADRSGLMRDPTSSVLCGWDTESELEHCRKCCFALSRYSLLCRSSW